MRTTVAALNSYMLTRIEMGQRARTERILIVEDEESLRRMAERILQSAGYTTV